MARPYKQTVDYFPHDTDASDGKTLTIIQAKYGNDGYAFWYKLLQLLGKAPGHYYDFNKPADWEFLLAKTHQNDTEKGKAILDTLALLDAIDPELYAHGVIWCQKFVDGVAGVYNRTEKGVPQRPGFLVNVENKGVSVNNNPEKTTETPQTKLKETKLNKTKYIPYPEFPNVDKMTKEEHQKLIALFGEAGTKDRIENLSLYIASKGDKYKNHYATILAWDKRDKKGGQSGTHRGNTTERTTDDDRRRGLA